MPFPGRRPNGKSTLLSRLLTMGQGKPRIPGGEVLNGGSRSTAIRTNARPRGGRRDQFSGPFQFAGGKVICQKLDDVEMNSKGIRNPSELSRGARVTRQTTVSFVRPFSNSICVSASNERGEMTNAP